MTTNLELYERQRRAEMMRRELFADLTRADLTDRLQELSTLEASVHASPQAPASSVLHLPQGVLFDNSSSRNKNDAMLGPDTTKLSVKALLRMTHVPTGFVHLLNGDTEPLVSFEIKIEPDRKFARLRITSYVEGYSARAVDTLELKAGQSLTFPQLPTFFPERLRQLQEQTRAMLHIEIEDLGGGSSKQAEPGTELHRSFPIWLLPPTTAWLAVRDPATGKLVDMTRYFAAWVTPNSPEVLRLLRKAADLVTPSPSIVGYLGSAADVTAQVRAIFLALKTEKMTYVNTILASGGSSDRFQQRVRLPRETLGSTSANCIDGTVLFASLLEAASLCPGIVTIPGHAFVAWKRSIDPAKDDWSFLETTMIGTSDFQQACDTATKLAQSPQRRLLSIPELRSQNIVPME